MARSVRYSYSKAAYNTSSSAYALPPAQLPVYDDEKERKKRLRLKKIREKAEEKRYNRQVAVHRAKLIFSVGVVVAGAFAFVNSEAQITQQTRTNKALNEELIMLQNDNAALQAEISDKIDLEYIRTEAINRLNMSEPQDYQVSYIDVPKQSYTVQYEIHVAAEDKDDDFSISALIDLFKL